MSILEFMQLFEQIIDSLIWIESSVNNRKFIGNHIIKINTHTRNIHQTIGLNYRHNF